jgi:hypothetical protein
MLNNSSFYCLDSKLNSKQSSRNACYAKYKSILSFIQNFQMKIQLTTPEGQSFHLCVTHPQGLANLESESSDFVIKIVPIESVMKIYNQMAVSDPVKVSRLVNELPAGLSQEDIPLLETIGDDNFEIRTVAYVVEALHLLHFTHIPVMVRAQDAHLL